MKKIRTIGLAALAAFAFSAYLGAGTAVADKKFASNSYPATISSTSPAGPQYLTVNSGGNAPCDLTLSATMSTPTSPVVATPSGTCSAFGIKRPFEANGCKFELNPDWNSFDIGPKGCGPIRVQIYNCVVLIGSQTGLKAQFENVTEGIKKVRFTSNATHLSYTAEKFSTSCGAGENGKLSGSWMLSTSPWDFFVEGDHAPAFEAERYPATFFGSQEAEDKHTINLGGVVFECGSVTVSAPTSGDSATLALAPSYGNCTVPGTATTFNIAMNGCSYVYSQPGGTQRPVDISCPAGQSIGITSFSCTVSIPAQKELMSVKYSNYNSSETGHDVVGITSNLSGLTYTVSKDGFLCPFTGTGTFANGTYKGGTLLQGKDSEGSLVNIRAGA